MSEFGWRVFDFVAVRTLSAHAWILNGALDWVLARLRLA